MKNITTEEVLKIIGPQEYSLADKGPVPGINVLEAWTPPPYKRVFNVHELYEIFSKECVTMIGDSTDRRAADTLHILLQERHNISGITKFFHKYKNRYQDHTRHNFVDGVFRTKACAPGTIDNLFKANYQSLLEYEQKKEKKYDIIVAATGPWNHIGKPKWFTPNETRDYIRRIIHHLDKEIPKDVLFIWKTSLWSWFGQWEVLGDDESVEMPKGNNYLIHVANEAAKETIREINSPRRIVLDFAAEIAPYSWEYRRPTNMEAEFLDYVPWHLGPKGRVLFAQMLAWEIARYRNSSLISGVIGTNNNTAGQGIVDSSGKNHSENSREMTHELAANETISGSSVTKASNDDNNDDTNEVDKENPNDMSHELAANETLSGSSVTKASKDDNDEYTNEVDKENPNDMSHELAANETNSGSSVTKPSSADNNEDTNEADEEDSSDDNEDTNEEVDESTTTAQVAPPTDPPFEQPRVHWPSSDNTYATSNTVSTAATEPAVVIDVVSLQDYIQIPEMPRTPTIRYFGLVLIILYAGLKMRSRGKSRTRRNKI
ncbi:unnamed protein product [Cylindrotheca closterium]|uniref:SGNH domain-containing protein n=1 Tax=Cylindrotheca closterium TaxID=2856 RepID=A0AAD2CV12_9STRA|nr:unnamed protein product [Cylindrotheca closterium]